MSLVLGPYPFSSYYKVRHKIITGVTVITKSVRYYKFDRKLLQSVTGITKCDKKLLQSVTGITTCDNYYKVSRNKVLVYPNYIFFRLILIMFYFYLQERMECKSCFDTPY